MTAPLGKKLMDEFVYHLKSLEGIGGIALFQDILSKKADLEFLLEELQDLEVKDYLGYEFESQASRVPLPLSVALPKRTERTFSDVAATARNLRRLIEREVFLHYRSFDKPTKLREHFSPLFEAAFINLPFEEPLVVFTTNYDPGVEEFCRQITTFRLFDGFKFEEKLDERVWSAASFARFEPEKDKRNIVLFKLHGSTNWFRSGKRIVKGPELYAGDDRAYSNVLIYPATRKVAIDEPFFTAYDFLQKCLSHARCLLAVGYSFRDEDAMTRLRSAVRSNPPLRIAVAGPNAARLTEQLRNNEIEAEAFVGPYLPHHVTGKAVSSRIQEFLKETLKV